MMPSITWPLDSPYAFSYWWSIGTKPLSLPVFFRYLDPKNVTKWTNQRTNQQTWCITIAPGEVRTIVHILTTWVFYWVTQWKTVVLFQKKQYCSNKIQKTHMNSTDWTENNTVCVTTYKRHDIHVNHKLQYTTTSLALGQERYQTYD